MTRAHGLASMLWMPSGKEMPASRSAASLAARDTSEPRNGAATPRSGSSAAIDPDSRIELFCM
jgi:hypothetical protein